MVVFYLSFTLYYFSLSTRRAGTDLFLFFLTSFLLLITGTSVR